MDAGSRPVYSEMMASVTPTREHLLEVGLKQLRSTGYTATGVKEVLDLAHVPKGSFYHYFPSKEAFVLELLERYASQEGERAQRIFSDASLSPLKQLRVYFEELFFVAGQRGEITGCLVGGMSLEIADHNPKLQAKLQTMYTVWQAGIAEVLRRAIKQGELKKSTRPDLLAEFLLNSYEGALVRMKGERSDRPLETFLYFVFDVLLKA